jgi:type I restriction enzyme, R subunit
VSHAQLMELEFEDNLCAELAERGWLYGGGKPTGWDIGLAMVLDDVLHWLSSQYPEEYEKAVPGDLVNGQKTDAERKLLQHITKELAKATKWTQSLATRSAGCSACCARGSPTPRWVALRRSSGR